jgi:hypothetical protein
VQTAVHAPAEQLCESFGFGVLGPVQPAGPDFVTLRVCVPLVPHFVAEHELHEPVDHVHCTAQAGAEQLLDGDGFGEPEQSRFDGHVTDLV